MNEFDQLVAELAGEFEPMAKALEEGDKKIMAAAQEGAEGDADEDGAKPHAEPDGDEGKGEGDDDGDEALMGKSFTMVLDDGTEVEAVDGTAMLKALSDRVEANEGKTLSALRMAVDMLGKQGKMLKSLQDEVLRLGNMGGGRKSVVSVHEKPAAGVQAAQSQQEGMTVQDFMAKAHKAFDEKKITGKELTMIDVSIRSGQQIDQGLMAKCL